MITLGKPLGGGIPAAAFGMSKKIFDKTIANMLAVTTDVNGVGGTMNGNALALAAIRATLEKVVTRTAFDHMIALAKCFNEGVQSTIRNTGVPWHSVRLGARVEYQFRSTPSRNGADAAAAADALLSKYMHLYALNRGILLTPFHNMALMSPHSTQKDVDQHTKVFQESVKEILA
jgi:glutamate-1-semialdehyde 2,1-aminomutase